MLENTNDTLDLNTLHCYEWDNMDELEGVNIGIPVDSIHQTIELPDTVFRESLIVHHSHPIVHQGMETRPDSGTPAWVFGDLLLLTALLCLLFRMRNIKIWNLLKSTIDLRSVDRLIRDCNLNRATVMLPMGLLVVAGVCLPVHQTLLPETGIPGYLALFGGGALLYILRNWLLRLLGNTFDSRNETVTYITSNYLYHLIEAVVIVALLYPYFYLPGGRTAMLYILVGFLVIAFLMRFLRSVKIFFTHTNGSRFYLFYYLCIVEAIPVLALIKWFFANRPIS